MLRLRIDLTAFEVKPKEVFWRLERDGILHKTVKRFATQLLQEYGIFDVKPLTYLDGTFLPESESPLIFRDGDLIRILPGKVNEKQVVSHPPRLAGTSSIIVGNGTAAIENQGFPDTRAEPANRSQEETGTIECAIESADDTELLDLTDPPETAGPIQKKRKRGKRQSRMRSKRVSFDVLNDENGRGDATPQLQSTPFRKRVPNDSVGELPHGSSVETRSEAYVTALESTPGVSRLSRMPMKASSVRKDKKLHSGIGYYLNLLGSGDSALTAGTSVASCSSPTKGNLRPLANVSNGGDGPCEDESSRRASQREDSAKNESLLPTLKPNDIVTCDLGMFSFNTSSVEHYPDVTLEILDNNTEKKSFIVRHIGGHLPDRVDANEFKVDWGMVTSVSLL